MLLFLLKFTFSIIDNIIVHENTESSKIYYQRSDRTKETMALQDNTSSLKNTKDVDK